MAFRRNLFDYLVKLKDDDLKEIKKYLDSPFFKINSRDRVMALFKLLERHHPKYEKNIDDFLADKLSIGLKSVRNLKTELVKCIEHYLQLKALNEQEQLKPQLMAYALDDLNMHQHFEKYADLQLKKLELKLHLNEADYQLKYELLQRKYAIVAENMLNTNNTALEEAINTFTQFYLYKSLKNLNGLIATNLMVDRGAEIVLTKQIINSITNIDLIDDVNIQTAYLIFKYYNISTNNLKEKETTYNNLKQLVLKDWEKLTDDYKYETYINMLNIIKVVAEINVEKYSNEAFIIHKFWIDKKVHQIHKEIHYHLFLSIVISSCEAQKLTWCEKFITTNQTMLSVNERKSTVSLCLAHLYFSNKQLDNAIATLADINPLGIYFDLLIRLLMLRCLFVANYDERFSYYYNSTYNFIRNHTELNENNKIYHLKFINYLRRVKNARAEKHIEKLINVKEEIETNINIINYRWLLKIINTLVNKI